MFTIQQIKEAHSKVKSGADFPAYIQDLIGLGVTKYETYVSDGHTDYSGENCYQVISDAKYATMDIAAESNADAFIANLKLHQQGHTDYPAFCRHCAEAGVEKWNVDMNARTCTYYDRSGAPMLEEKIPG